MPWYVPWSDNIKKRICRYLLQRYLGQFLEEKLSLDQLSVDLYNGTGIVSDVSLDCESLNELGEAQGWPIEFVDGFIKQISVSVPWVTILKDDSFVEVSGLSVTIQPKLRSENATSMLESMWSSMTSSMQLAQECLQQEVGPTNSQPMEGIELFAQTIDSILCRVKVKLKDTKIRLEHVPKNSLTGVALEIHVKNIDYLDEAGLDPPSEYIDSEKNKTYVVSTFTSKKLAFEGVTLHTDEFPVRARTISKSVILQSQSRPSKAECVDLDLEGTLFQSGDTFYDSRNAVSSSETSSHKTKESSPACDSTTDDSDGAKSSSDKNDANVSLRSDPILFAKLTGRQELSIKLKQAEQAAGPKVDIQLITGSLICFLSPRQLHVLTELVSGLAYPHLEDTSNVPNKKGYLAECKPMRQTDFDRVEAQLLGGISQPGAPSLMARYGWSSPHLDDSDIEEDKFYPLHSQFGGQMSDSCMSSVSSMSSSYSSNASSIGSASAAKVKSKKNRRAPQVDGDPNAEVSHVTVRLASFACVLLHEDILTLSMSLGGDCLASSSVKKMQISSKNFFDNLGLFAITGYGNKDFAEAGDRFDSATNYNNLRLIAAPLFMEGNEKTASQGCLLTGTLTVSRFHLKECLYSNNSGNKNCAPVHSIDLISFTKSESPNEGKKQSMYTNHLGATPDIKIHFKQMQKNIRIAGEKRLAYPTNEFNVSLQPCTIDMDITLMDRICAVLNPQIFNHSNDTMRNAPTQSGSLQTNSPHFDNITSVEISCPSFSMKLRFPIADLRPLYDMSRAHWWQRTLRKDYLLATFTQAVFSTSLQSNSDRTTVQLKSKEIDLYYFESEEESSTHIAHADYEQPLFSNEANVSMPMLKLTVISSSSRIHSMDATSDDESCFAPPPTSMAQSTILMDKLNDGKPSPFSSKKMVHESDTPHDKTAKEDAEELIIPGNNEEMREFANHSLEHSLLQIECNLPVLSIQFNSKHMCEVIYNRINSDLLLWESSAPYGYQKSSKVTSNPDAAYLNNLDFTESIHPSFSMCKSGINYDSDSDSSTSDDSNVYYSVYDQRSRHKAKLLPPTKNGNKYHVSCFTLHVNKGIFTLYTPVRDSLNHVLPSQNGEIVIKAEALNMCSVSGVNGAPRSALMSLRAYTAQLYHCGLVPIPLESPPLRLYGYNLPSHLEETISPSETGICLKNVNRKVRDMISVAISVQPHKDLPRFKTIRVTAGISNATLCHRTPAPNRSWLSQLLDMMDVLDYPIPGYEPSTVVTELHVHLWDSAIDYRPLNLPLRTVITMSSFSVSSNVVAQTNASNLRFIAEDCSLFLSDVSSPPGATKKKTEERVGVDLINDYVGILELGLFELSLRINDRPGAPLTSLPRVDLRASSSSVHVRTCADSAAALCRLIAYVAADGDRVSLCSAQASTVGGSLGTLEGDSLVDVDEAQPEEICDLSRSQVEHVNKLITEAMTESLNIEVSDAENQSADKEGVDIFFFPDESNPQVIHSSVGSEDPDDLLDVEPSEECDEQMLPPIVQVARDLGDVYSPVKVAKAENEANIIKTRIVDDAPNTDDEFCLLGLESTPTEGDPINPPLVRWLTTATTEIIDDYFSIPLGTADLLKPPKNFPSPVTRYTLCEMTIVWHMYGGNDFKVASSEESPRMPHKKTVTISDTMQYSPRIARTEEADPYNVIPHSPVAFTTSGVSFSRSSDPARQSPKSKRSISSTVFGGPGRRHDILMELQLTKVKFQHETYPASGTYASRQILIVGLLEVRDRLESSHINKFLYHHTTEQQPKQKHANMVVIKAVHMRPDPRHIAQECCLKVSLLPLRLNIDQDALLFLIDFFTKLGEEEIPCEEEGVPNLSGSNQSLHSAGTSKHSTPTHQPPVMSMGNSPQVSHKLKRQSSVDTLMTNSDYSADNVFQEGADAEVEPIMENYEAERLVSDNLIQLEEGCRAMSAMEATSDSQSRTEASDDLPIYFRSVVFSPDVPIRLDYQGKRVDLTHGPLAGLLMGLGQLNCSELTLKRLSYRHGLLGVERLIKWILQEWLSDIKRNQLPGLLGGVGPMHSLLQLFQGVRDLIWLPVEQYRRDGRLAKGLRRGAASFTARTAVAALDITARIVYLIQATAETAYDMVSPRPGLRTLRGTSHGGRRQSRRRDHTSQPQDIREGVTNAYLLVKEGLNETAHTLVAVATSERDARGYSGAVGGVLRQLPPTVVAPLVLAAAATSDVLGGVRSQLVPDARKEASDKWRDTADN